MERGYKILIPCLFAVILIGAGFLVYLYFFPSLLLAPPEQGSKAILEKEIFIDVNDNGVNEERILWKISVPDRLSFIPPSEWGISIPKNAKSIRVSSGEEELDYVLDESKESYNLLKFKNKENIRYNSNFYFDINYKTENIVFEPYHYFSQAFDNEDDKFSLVISLPKDSEPIFISKDASEEIVQERKLLRFEKFEKGNSETIQIEFEIPGQEPAKIEKIENAHFEIFIPEKYADYYKNNLLGKAESGLNYLENLYGFSSPYKWEVDIIGNPAEKFEEQSRGFYLGDGKIQLHATTQFLTDKEALRALYHEIAHGFNAEIFGESARNNWFNEGSAEFLSLHTLENLGYDVTDLKEMKIELLRDCEAVDESFIAQWSPSSAQFSNSGENIFSDVRCINPKENALGYGYAKSYKIIDDLVNLYGAEKVFKNLNSTAKNLKMEFSSDKNIFNNQINLVLSNSVGEDLTDFFLLHNINVERPGAGLITGKPTYLSENQKKNSPAWAILVIAVLMIMLIKIWKRFKR